MKIRIPFTTLALLLAINFTAKAQTDTTLHQLGRINLPKNFTQAVTIKTADIEKMPFTNVSDVITTWLYGYYGDKKSYVYVVDGLLNTDVNAFSIYDVDEITMVQNAAAYLNGAAPGQVLLVVKTKRAAKVGSGVNVNGQTNLVNQRNPNGSGWSRENNYYNQYYLSAYKNTGKINAGVSASVQHVTYPVASVNTAVIKPYNTDRFRFNGYLTAKLSSANTLNITAGYVPQNDDVNIEMLTSPPASGAYTTTGSKDNGTQKLLYANVGFNSTILPGLVNRLNVGYQSRKVNVHFLRQQTTVQQYPTQNYTTTNQSVADSTGNLKNIIINDDLSYYFQIGAVSIQPAVNLTYKKFTSDGSYSFTTSGTFQPTSYSNSRSSNRNTSVLLLTPSLTFNYADAVFMQVGLQKSLNNSMYAAYKINAPVAAPFVNVGLDIFQLADVASTSSGLMFTASYTKQLGLPFEPSVALSDQIAFVGVTYPYNAAVNLGQTFNQFQTGLTYSILNKRLSFSYNYQQIKNSQPVAVSIYSSPSFTLYETFLYARTTHINRFEVNANILQGKFKWNTVLNANVIRYVNPNLLRIQNSGFPMLSNSIVTGGFINRFAYNNFTAGLDAFYCFNQPSGIFSITSFSKYNSINLQNIYVGYTFKALNLKNLEVYANSRNMLMNSKSTITDNMRYYGIGFKASL